MPVLHSRLTVRRKARAAASVLALAAVSLAVGSCGGETATETATQTVAGAETETQAGPRPAARRPDLSQQCENPVAGYTVRYPEGWHANSGDVSERCSFFHPQPFELPRNTEAPDVAIMISREPVAFREVAGGDPAIRIIEREEMEIDGRRAARRETEATGEGLFAAGRRGYQYLVDLDGETLIASTYAFPGLEYERNRTVLDEMVESLRLR